MSQTMDISFMYLYVNNAMPYVDIVDFAPYTF